MSSSYSVGIDDKDDVIQLFQNIESTAYQNNVLYYITGFCVRKVMSKLTCEDCSKALVVPIPAISDHSYFQPEHRVNMPIHTRLFMRKKRFPSIEDHRFDIEAGI